MRCKALAFRGDTTMLYPAIYVELTNIKKFEQKRGL